MGATENVGLPGEDRLSVEYVPGKRQSGLMASGS